MKKELEDITYAKIKKICAQGDNECEKKNYKEAVKKYRKAWELIPQPKTDWNASTWVLTAIADAYLFNGDYDYAKDSLEYAMHCPEALGNPYIHLRLGQAYYELQEIDKAADQLTRAYMGGGIEIFEGQGNKYLDFLKSKIKI